MDLKEWSNSGTCKPKAQLNGDTLKSAIVYMIAECDLSFATVQKKSFRELVYNLKKLSKPAISVNKFRSRLLKMCGQLQTILLLWQ
ncbi:hypothetical protein H4Q26_003911 [Puccinia striiformis f. sp. tritici PST-130]|nr:hypothetical protein H4Q26_003911 [Puccinia striiformis f. sp. tritici PST-130]